MGKFARNAAGLFLRTSGGKFARECGVTSCDCVDWSTLTLTLSGIALCPCFRHGGIAGAGGYVPVAFYVDPNGTHVLDAPDGCTYEKDVSHTIGAVTRHEKYTVVLSSDAPNNRSYVTSISVHMIVQLTRKFDFSTADCNSTDEHETVYEEAVLAYPSAADSASAPVEGDGCISRSIALTACGTFNQFFGSTVWPGAGGGTAVIEPGP